MRPTSHATVPVPLPCQGSGINVGLLYLTIVIRELSEKGSTLSYRNSVLTELLKPGELQLGVGCGCRVQAGARVPPRNTCSQPAVAQGAL